MNKEKKVEIKYITLNTALIVAMACLIAGFLGGVVYSSFKSGSARPGQRSSFQDGPPGQTDVSTQQAKMILALESKVAEDPRDMEAWVQLGNLYFDTNNPQKAIHAYTRYIEINPGNPDVLTDLGIMYRRNGQFAEAVDAFDQAIAIDPKHPQAWFNRGIVFLHNLNDPVAALKSWEELIKVDPGFKGPGGQPIDQMVDNIKKSLAAKRP
ncbi:MAG: tetratricopeptide repeat protein [Candidatus Aminicenantes bacterium]|nr:tetratricopeptide repeat protein [Candidatus Aminicenantes bacterium]